MNTETTSLSTKHVTWYSLIDRYVSGCLAYLLAIFGMIAAEGDVL